jgi:hypothetical protein
MIYQAHFQDRKDVYRTEFVAQSGNLEDYGQVRKWLQSVAERHPLPEGKAWMLCDETSQCFTRMRVIE